MIEDSIGQDKNSPLISVITVVLNDELHIASTIESVLTNKNQYVEYIVVDGASRDSSLSIINKYTHSIDCINSEPDKGISDAFNKGFGFSKGKWLYYLNSGDTLQPGILEKVIPILQSHPDKDLVSGRINLVAENGLQIGIYGKPYKTWRFHLENNLPHQGMLINRNYFVKYGLYDLSFKIAMDYEHLLRKDRLDTYFIDIPFSNMLYGGVSLKKIPQVIDEFKRALQTHKKQLPIIITMCYYIKQLLYLRSQKRFEKQINS